MAAAPISALVLAVLASAGAGPPHDAAWKQAVREFKTEVLLARMMAEIEKLDPPPATEPTRVSLPDDVVDLLIHREAEDPLLGEGENLIFRPVNEDSNCTNTSAPCSRFEFEVSPGGRPIAGIHVWVRHGQTTPHRAEGCVGFSPCHALLPHRHERGWTVFKLPVALDLSSDVIPCSIECYDFPAGAEVGQDAFLVASTSATVPRARRSLPAEECSCCLGELHVSFKDIGWHWVVAPPGFNANMCEGRCQEPTLNAFPKHYHRLMSALARNRTERSGWTPCCSPTRLGPLDMIYIAANATAHNETFIHHKIPDMVTEACGCW